MGALNLRENRGFSSFVSGWHHFAFALLSALMLNSCNCGDPSALGQLQARLNVPKTEIDMGAIYVGFSKTIEVELSAEGDFPIDFVIQVVGNDASLFNVTPLAGAIPNNGFTSLSVTGSPERLGPMKIQVHVFTNANTGEPSENIFINAEGKLAPDCEDGNGCTTDRFDPELHKCVYVAFEGACDDRNRCTHKDRCRDGQCIGEALECDDDSFCTDNLCNPLVGCVFPATRTCDDNNPCTSDTCLAPDGCAYEDMPDGTFCDDFEICTEADICANGVCTGVPIPEGTMCDDGDPCSKNEVCTDGKCIDENYEAAGPGELKFQTEVNELSVDAGRNPIIDRDGSVYLGLQNGLVAIDSCGTELWRNEVLGVPRWGAALSLPGRVFVPTGSKLHAVDMADGMALEFIDLHTVTASTSSTASTMIKDVVVQANGALLVSIKTWTPLQAVNGYLISWTPGDAELRVLHHWPDAWLEQLTINRTEVLNGVLIETATISPQAYSSRVVQVDLNTQNILWTSSATTTAQPSYLALGRGRALAWSIGEFHNPAVEAAYWRLPSTPFLSEHETGAPVFGNSSIYWPFNRTFELATMGGSGLSSEIVASSTTGIVQWRVELTGAVKGSSGLLGRSGLIYFVTNAGRLVAINELGQIVWEQAFGSSMSYISNPTLTSRGVLVFAADNQVFGIQTDDSLGSASWPRFRHDNLSTSHR